jgi:hypothetical protein
MDEVKSVGHNGNNTFAPSFWLRDLLTVVFRRKRLMLLSFTSFSLSTFLTFRWWLPFQETADR